MTPCKIALTLARGLVKVVSRGGLSQQDEAILAPVWKLPAEVRPVLSQFWTKPHFFEALGNQIESICESAAQVLAATANGFLRPRRPQAASRRGPAPALPQIGRAI